MAEVDDLLEQYAEAWTALSRLLLAPPSGDTLVALRDPELLASWPLAADDATHAALSLLGSSVEGMQAVADDYARLFVGPGPLRVPPYESVHRGPEKLLFDEHTFAVREAYAEFGLEPRNRNQEPDDHVGLELEFCATLAERAMAERENTGRYVMALSEFLRDHVAAWVPGFATDLQRLAETDVYRAIGGLLGATVASSVRTFCEETP